MREQIIGRMVRDEWQRRLERAAELSAQFPFAGEILRFYLAVAHFQQTLYREFARTKDGDKTATSGTDQFSRPLPPDLIRGFKGFLSLVEENGTGALRDAARELQTDNDSSHAELLNVFWRRNQDDAHQEGPNVFFARTFLQPYAASVRSRSTGQVVGAPTPLLCPFCGRKPGVGVLRPLGDGGQRSLVCSFCMGEWQFRRIVCPGCGEEDPSKLPVYKAEEFNHVRVEACDSCRYYIKTVDLTRDGLADPTVDEIASIPLDLWAQGQGYTKLQVNLMLL